MEAKEPVDISPLKLKFDAEEIQEILAHHIGDQCQCDGLGTASYAVARHIAKRIANLQNTLEDCQAVRDSWCAEYTRLRDATLAMIEVDDRDALTDPDRTATDEYRSEVWANLRAAVRPAT